MSDTEDNIQDKKPQKSKMAIAAVLFGILGILILVLRVVVYHPWWSEFVARNIVGLSGIIGLVMGIVVLARISKRIATITLLILICPLLLYLCSLLILLLARSSAAFRFLLGCNFYLTIICLVCVLAVPATRKWKARLKGKFKEGTFANLGMVIGALLAIFWFVETCGPVSTALAMACGHNLNRLGKAMLIYANDNQGHYPEPNKWCDLILKRNQVDREHFYCPGVKFQWKRQVFPWPVPKNEKCYYAMNPNCEPNSPKDIVLLFETKGGWNKFGGSELMTTENHIGRCNVLFNDGRVEHVMKKQFEELKWGVE
jgi:prepilin-type processing-associated H-X9-DG protein